MDISKHIISKSILVVFLLFTGRASTALLSTPDLNGDGAVNIYDLSLVASCFDADLSVLPQCAVADITGDGEISMSDVNIVVGAFGQTVEPNTPPTADAGPDQLAFVSDTAILDGSNSSDPDSDPLSFTWTLIGVPAGSEALLSDEHSVNPTFTIDLPGDYSVQLVVNDGTDDSLPDIVIISTENSPPVADAGVDQLVFVGETATLNGAASSDVDGDILTFLWSLISTPNESAVILSNPTAINPTLNIDVPGSYVVQLIVDDGTAESTPDSVTISTENNTPVANAGTDQLASVGDTVTLDASTSSDVDGDELTFSWALTSKPSESLAVLTNPTSIDPTFIIDIPGVYIAQLIVNDGIDDSIPDTITISTENSLPVADAGSDQLLFVGDTAVLDGSESYDVDNDDLSYFWSFITVPDGSLAEVSDPTLIDPSFELDMSGTYVVQLIVNDGTSDSAPDTVTISTENTSPVADAGEDLLVPVGTTVDLDGRESYDADKDPLTYSWSFVTLPDDSAAVLTEPTGINPSFTVDIPGAYVVQLIVNDGTADSLPDSIVVTASEENTAPTADASDDQSVTVDETATLDGSASQDPDGDTLTFSWTLLSSPAGSTASLVDANTPAPSITPDVAGDYQIQLIVNDGELNSLPDSVVVSATAQNVAPTADAGDDQSVTVGETATLDGSGSQDPDGDTLTFSWTLLSSPAGSTASLVDANTPVPSITPDVAGDYLAQLAVNDGELNSAPDTVVVTARALPTVVANDDEVDTDSDLAVMIPVLDNDLPSIGLVVDPATLTQPANGEVTLNADNTINYRQAGLAFAQDGMNAYRSNCSDCHGITGFTGTDTFTYSASNGINSGSAKVTVNVLSFDPDGIDISGMALTSCSDLPSINAHRDCAGANDALIREIGEFLIQSF